MYSKIHEGVVFVNTVFLEQVTSRTVANGITQSFAQLARCLVVAARTVSDVAAVGQVTLNAQVLLVVARDDVDIILIANVEKLYLPHTTSNSAGSSLNVTTLNPCSVARVMLPFVPLGSGNSLAPV